MAKRKMLRFAIDELSGVDKAAQEGALAVIMKRADPEEIDKFHRNEFSNPKMLSTVDGHTHLFDDIGKAGETTWSVSEGEDNGHTHLWIRQKDGTVLIGEAEGHDHIVLEKRVTKEDITAASGGVAKKTEDTSMSDDTKKTAKGGADEISAQEKINADLTKRLEKSEAVGTLTDTQRAFYNAIEGDEAQATFLAKSADERNAEVEKTQGEDPVVYTSVEGEIFRKSDDSRLVTMAKDRDEDRRELVSERAARRNDSFTKRAETELANLPGDLTMKVSLLSVIEDLDEETRKGATALLKAANDAVTGAFKEAGHRDVSSSSDEEAQLHKLALAGVKDGVSYAKSYSTACKSAEGRDLYKAIIGRAS